VEEMRYEEKTGGCGGCLIDAIAFIFLLLIIIF
jgi:hypothetical protein